MNRKDVAAMYWCLLVVLGRVQHKGHASTFLVTCVRAACAVSVASFCVLLDRGERAKFEVTKETLC